MKSHTTTTITILTTLTALAIAMSVSARPVDFSEVSLWVRVQETDLSIVQQVSQRKLAHALTPQQEATLKAQGASDSLVQSLRSPNVVASAAELAASEPKPQAPRPPQAYDRTPE